MSDTYMAPLPNNDNLANPNDPSHPLPASTSYFRDARDFQIIDSQLTEVHGDQIIIEASSSLKLLLKTISPGATYDSAERSPPPRCHRKTRHSVINDIMSWISDSDPARRLLWLNGAPGVGKSAVSQTIAEICAERGQLAGSFFFSGESEERKTAQRFVFTLAYQLSVVIPAVRVGIEREIKTDPHILSKSLGHQLDGLILQHLSQLDDLPPMVIIVDGLDECNQAGQASVLELIPKLLSGLPQSFRLVVASRPENIIKEAFDACLQDLSRRVTLDERYSPEKDIEIFLRSRLSQLFKRRGSQSYASRLDNDIRLLVNACSGQFLCAVTITRYIEDGPHRPDVLLKNLLDTTASGSKHAALTPLDSLYSRILGTCPDPSRLLSILGFVLVSSCRIKFIEGLLGLDSGDVIQYLRGFDSVLHVPRESEKIQTIRIRHPSFREFLLDSSRSGPYFIDSRKQHAQVATCMLSLHLRENPDESLLGTSLEYWGLHCSQAVLTNDLLKALKEFDLRSWLEKSVHGTISYNTSDLVEVMGWMSNTNHPSLNIIYIGWRNVCYDIFYAELVAFDLRPPALNIDKFLALMVVALMANQLNLDPLVVCDVLEPFVTGSKTLWFTLDSRIGIASPFEPSSEEYRSVAERFYHDTLNSRSNGRSTVQLDTRKLKASDGTFLPRFNLDNFDTFGRFKLDSVKCHTHFALACLSYMGSTSSRYSYNGTTPADPRDIRAYDYAVKYWAYHVTKSLPTQAIMVNLRDFIHSNHSRTHGSGKLGLVINWLKSLPNPPRKLVFCWESALRKRDCGDTLRSRSVTSLRSVSSTHHPPIATPSSSRGLPPSSPLPVKTQLHRSQNSLQ